MTSQVQDDTLAQLQAGKLAAVKHLKLSCNLTQFPPQIFDLADSLEVLDLSGNALSDLPRDLNRLKKLRILFCSNNQFTHLPEVLGQCAHLSMIGFKANRIKHIPESAIPTRTLRWFIVTDNALTSVPNTLGECAKLQKLMLAGNQLTTLPNSLARCHALELLRISANQFETLPDFLFDLPKLTWLAYAGNPFCNAIEQTLVSQQPIHHIDWQALTLQQALGEGASGITYQALLKNKGAQEPVAVKLFKSDLTSDGLPRCEMHANLLAGEHPNLIGIKGIIHNHPQGASGLVMPLLDADLKVLANPPSFESCSRDVYANDFSLTPEQAGFIFNGITQAAEHLHANGLMHGDLYAHNILWGADKVALSDLGGASFLPLDNPELTRKILKLEARALAVLAKELKKYSE
ncbi:leucine-rich repeat-containing protein kinase family protein [Methylophilus aquaticus]|uniref:Leucine-rich repeat-containing protein kinase family protein n=1 Tax=Methylophilus aquaticus TaxID=1971610 RepID=A0ABT9JQD9_9PROT|nr:leucine-rich repeat-containing protein kinase family protein [Methylophilus aquaticus]MDP8566767.1 leucine-rich repeat-containing protein kinase family protein [Methylophilus aquaticus]